MVCNDPWLDPARMGRLRIDFAKFYREHRCPLAPPEPMRLFNLVLGPRFREFREKLSPEEVFAVVFATLGYRGSDPAGMFDTFDMAEYTGALPADDHFVNLFARKLDGRLRNALRRPKWARRGLARNSSLSSPHTPDLEQSRLAKLDANVQKLSAREQAVLQEVYWNGASRRKAAKTLGLNHQTVNRAVDSALEKLKEMFAADDA